MSQAPDYFGKDGAVAEEDYEGGSQDGEFSDEDHQDDIDPMLGVMAQQDGAGGGYDGGRIDGGRVNMSEEAFSPFEELADTNLPKGAEARSGEDKKAWKAKESSAAIGGMNPHFDSTPTRNLRDLEQLPYAGRRGAQRMLAGFGVRPGENTRERVLPGSIGEGLARRNLGMARQRFKSAEQEPAAASPFPLAGSQQHRVIGPRHAGDGMKADPNEVPLHPENPKATVNIARTKERLGKFRTANKRAKARDRRWGWDAPGLKPDMAPTMGEIAEAGDEGEFLSDEPGSAPIDAGYFSSDRHQIEPVQARPASIDLDEDSGTEKKLSIPELEEPAPKKPGFFSRLGGALAKAGRVAGNALSSAGRGLKSLFGFGKRAAPMNAPDTSTAAERARNARMGDAESEYERQQSRPGMAELQNALDDPVNQDTVATASQAGINLRAPIKDDELEQLQRMMQVDSEPARDEEAKWYPEVMESRMYDDYVSPRDDEARVLPDASGMKADHNHFKEPAEAVDARYKAKRKAGVPSPESYTDEQADDLDLWNERFTRYQGEAHEYQEGGGVEYSGGMAPEDRKQISQQFFQKFQENPRLSFKPYARNRQEDVYDAQDAGQHNPLYPAPLPGASEQETSMDVDPGTGEKIGYSVDDDYFMSPEDKKAKWEQKQEEHRRMIAIEAPYKKKRLEAEEKRRREELSRLRERQDVGYEGDLKANEEAMGKGASHTEAIHAGALDGLNENYFSQTSTEGTAPIMEGNAPEPPKAGTKKSSRLKFWK